MIQFTNIMFQNIKNYSHIKNATNHVLVIVLRLKKYWAIQIINNACIMSANAQLSRQKT